MNIHHWLIRGAIIAVGLAIGLMLRLAMTPEPAAPSNTPARDTLSSTPRAQAQVSPLIKTSSLLEQNNQKGLTPEEHGWLMESFFDLHPDDLKKLTEMISTSNLMVDRYIVNSLFTAWAETDPLGALKAISLMPPSMRHQAKRSVLRTWVLIDPDEAFSYVHRAGPIPRAHILTDSESNLWYELASEKPQQALARASEISNPEKRLQCENEIIRLMSFVDPESSLEWIKINRKGAALKETTTSIIYGWAARQPHQAFDYVLQLSPKLQNDQMFDKLGVSISREVDLALELIGKVPEPYRNDFLGGVIKNVSQYDSKRAAELGRDMPESTEKRSAYHDLASHWASANPIAAGEWLTTLPRSRSRDLVIRSFSRQIQKHDPETAASWLVDMDHQSSRESALHNTLLEWLQRDQSAAKAWINLQPMEKIPPRLREHIIK